MDERDEIDPVAQYEERSDRAHDAWRDSQAQRVSDANAAARAFVAAWDALLQRRDTTPDDFAALVEDLRAAVMP